MTAADDFSAEWINSQDDELVRRLRTLEWPRVRPELRERCWEEFSRQIAERQRDDEPRERFDIGDRYHFSRRLPPTRVAVAHGWHRRDALARPLLVA